MAFGFRGKYVPFFDAAGVIKFMDEQTRKALSRFGAFVRQRAKTSIRNRKAVSEPGRPPSSHKGPRGGALKRLIFFSYDPATNSVVIGPLAFTSREKAQLGNQTGAEVLEKGGEVRLVASKGRIVILHYRARPFMQPAFDKELPNAPKQFAAK